MAENRWVLISGCSGGGKSSLLAELEARGFASVPEPGRRIVTAETKRGGRVLPWIDLAAFAERAMAVARADRAAAADRDQWVFFDRGLVDAAVALELALGEPVLGRIAAERYHRRVFVVPPWPEIYINDAGRRHGLREAVDEYERLLKAFETLDYDVEVLPKTNVEARADFIFQKLG
ncbi:AAA family ATPase [Novosphingobium lindaniclasticum]|jgi:predicted ATPase|uniref:AAA family ATPase n=1 Tax=Novosphingobium lindaniclasticum TaxID=1329895 RepID=UPI002409E541|nr:AAA family ATPase [Novosphingobium lindaniclasticum]